MQNYFLSEDTLDDTVSQELTPDQIEDQLEKEIQQDIAELRIQTDLELQHLQLMDDINKLTLRHQRIKMVQNVFQNHEKLLTPAMLEFIDHDGALFSLTKISVPDIKHFHDKSIMGPYVLVVQESMNDILSTIKNGFARLIVRMLMFVGKLFQRAFEYLSRKFNKINYIYSKRKEMDKLRDDPDKTTVFDNAEAVVIRKLKFASAMQSIKDPATIHLPMNFATTLDKVISILNEKTEDAASRANQAARGIITITAPILKAFDGDVTVDNDGQAINITPLKSDWEPKKMTCKEAGMSLMSFARIEFDPDMVKQLLKGLNASKSRLDQIISKFKNTKSEVDTDVVKSVFGPLSELIVEVLKSINWWASTYVNYGEIALSLLPADSKPEEGVANVS